MGSLPGDATAPYFFLSYAHTPGDEFDSTDPDMWVQRLFRDLCGHIKHMTDVPEGASGFMDRSMKTGQIWTDELADSLAGCRVFVPLYSPRYFRSSWCGREWTVFGRRPVRHRTEGRPGTPSAVVPALWAPVEDHQLPASVCEVQYTDPKLGAHYRDFGLYGLMKVSAYRRHYERAVLELARRIIHVGENVIVEPGRRTALPAAPDAFASVRGRTLRITVAAPSQGRLPKGRSADYYGPTALDWNPYRPECPTPLAEVAVEIAERLQFRPDLQEFDTWHSEADGSASGTGPEVVLLDRWLLRDPEQRTRLGKFDASHRPATGLMVPWNHADPDSDDARGELATEAGTTLPRMMNQGSEACRPAVQGIPDQQSFRDLMPRVVQWAATQHLKHAPAQPPQGPAIPRFRLNISGDDGRPLV